MSSTEVKASPTAEPLSPLPVVEKGEKGSGDSDVDVCDITSMTDAEKRALYRKMDWHILPFLAILLSMSFVDRGNIGNALSLGLVQSLKLQIGLRVNWVASIFYFGYGLFQLPSQLMVKLFGPSKWIPIAMFSWGLTMALASLVKTYDNLLIVRFFLGMAEGGIIPAATYYLSLWYPRDALGLRSAYIFATAALGLAWGGILAYGIDKMNKLGGLSGWAWIFALEGIFTCLLACLGFIMLYDSPDSAKFLTTKEKAQLQEILRQDRGGTSNAFKWKVIAETMLDWKIWGLMTIYLGILVGTFDIALFLPTIIKDLGFGASKAQLLLVPPHAVAWFSACGIATISDRLQRRGPFLLLFSLVAMAGFGMLRSPAGTKNVGYAGTFLATMGTLTCVPVALAWFTTNAGGEMKRAVTLGAVLGTASLGGIISSFTYQTREAPHYKTGHDVGMGMCGLIFVSTAIMMFTYSRLNKAKEEKCARENINADRAEEFAELNDDSPLFRYTL